MSVTDIVILAICALAAAWGCWRGFIRQLGSFVAILLGIVACQLFGPKVAASLGWQLWITDVVLFLIVYIAVILLSRLIHSASKALLLGPVNRAAGALLGIVKALILASIVLNVWLAFEPKSDIRRGVVTPTVCRIAPKLFGYVAGYINV